MDVHVYICSPITCRVIYGERIPYANYQCQDRLTKYDPCPCIPINLSCRSDFQPPMHVFPPPPKKNIKS